MPASEYKCDETVKAGEQQKFVLHLSLKTFAKSEENFYWCIQIKICPLYVFIKHCLYTFLCTLGICVKRYWNSISKKPVVMFLIYAGK